MADVTNEIMTNDKTKILSGEFLNFYTPRRQRIRSLKVYFSPKQEGSGTPSPENVRPISGWTGVEVQHCGKNLLETNINSYHHPSNTKIEPNDMIFTDGELSGTIISGQRDIGIFVYDNILPPGTYTLSFDYINGIGNYYWRPCIIGKPSLAWTTSYKSIPMASNDSGHITTTFTAEEDFCINLSLNCFGNASKTAVNKIYNLQLELGSQPTEYTPYKTNLSIPKEYQEVEYIQGQYGYTKIDTGIKGNDDNLVISGKVSSDRWMKYYAFFGNYIDENHNVTRLIYSNASNDGSIITNINRKASNSAVISCGFTPNTTHEFIIQKMTIMVDGVNYDYGGDFDGTENNTNIALNANNINVNPTVTTVPTNTWYYFKIQSGNTVLRNFIPCYRKSDKVAGMYDAVSGQFYTNSGTGEFITGPAVNRYGIDWSEDVGTVYGGYVDLVSGELVEEYGAFEFTGDENIKYVTSWNSNGNYCINDLGVIPFCSQSASEIYCNILESVKSSFFNANANQMSTVGSDDDVIDRYRYIIWGKNGFGETVNECKAKLKELYDAGTPLTVVSKYAKAFVKTHALSPTTLSTLAHDNNFWSNADRIEIEYDYIGIFDPIESRKNIFTATPHLETLSGMNMTFNTDMERELKKCIINFSPIQLGTGDPSPENVREIYGRNEIGIGLSNENLLPKDPPTEKIYNRTTGGGVWAGASKAKVCAIIPLPYGATIYLQKNSTGHGGTINLGRHTVINVGDYYYQSSGFTNDINVIKTANDALEYYVNFYSSAIAVFNATWTDYGFMISYGNSRKIYVPPMGTILNVDFPEEIYGGYVNVLTGELWRTWRYIPLSNLTWSYNKSWKRFESSYITSATRAVYGQQNVYCDIYKAFSNTTGEDFQALGNYAITFNSSSPSNPYLIINDSRYTTKDDFVTNLTGNIAYKLKTPQLITTLEPQVIRTLQGVNNIWSNANGNLEIAYWKHGDDAYQHIPTSNAITTASNNLIVTEDGYVIGEEDDFIVY